MAFPGNLQVNNLLQERIFSGFQQVGRIIRRLLLEFGELPDNFLVFRGSVRHPYLPLFLRLTASGSLCIPRFRRAFNALRLLSTSSTVTCRLKSHWKGRTITFLCLPVKSCSIAVESASIFKQILLSLVYAIFILNSWIRKYSFGLYRFRREKYRKYGSRAAHATHIFGVLSRTA